MTTSEKKQVIASIRQLGINANMNTSIKNILYKYIDWVCRNISEEEICKYGVGIVIESKYFPLYGFRIEDISKKKRFYYGVVQSDFITQEKNGFGVIGSTEGQRSAFTLQIPEILQEVGYCMVVKFFISKTNL